MYHKKKLCRCSCAFCPTVQGLSPTAPQVLPLLSSSPSSPLLSTQGC